MKIYYPYKQLKKLYKKRSLRQIGDLLGVSHTAIANALNNNKGVNSMKPMKKVWDYLNEKELKQCLAKIKYKCLEKDLDEDEALRLFYNLDLSYAKNPINFAGYYISKWLPMSLRNYAINRKELYFSPDNEIFEQFDKSLI
ncbi:MAG: hypothetical protein ACTSWK_07260 [Promethearchaeota archaeon]